jgi:pyridoxamine 5'-phosphate oxidase
MPTQQLAEGSSSNTQAALGLADCPFTQLRIWLHEAMVSGMKYPTAMTLATLGTEGRLDQRIVLLKHVDPDGLVFFAGDDSKKVCDLLSHPSVSVHFPWHELNRQVRISGTAQKLSAALTTQYFITKPDFERSASSVQDADAECYTNTRNFLFKQYEMMRSKFYSGGNRATNPWSGYQIIPDRFEYWQGGESQLRERFVYEPAELRGWRIISILD